MSLKSFAPELLMEVFAHLTDVPSKVRLERVSKKFRDCIRNQESWKYNSELKIDKTWTGEQVHSFLSRAKVITRLSLVDCGKLDSEILIPLWAFADKLKVRQFSYLPDDGDLLCVENNQAVACCLGMFSKSLETVALNCCCGFNCPLNTTFEKALPLCTNLQHVALGGFNLINSLCLESLHGMPVQTLSLEEFVFGIGGGERLAAVCNATKGHSLHTIIVKRDFGSRHRGMQFDLNEFCQSLEPAAAEAITTLKVSYAYSRFVDVLPTLPTLLPNLTTVVLRDELKQPKPEDAMQLAEALGSFMHACLNKEEKVKLQFTLRSSLFPDVNWNVAFWDAVNLLGLPRSATKRAENMARWKRSLDNGMARVRIRVK